MALPFLGSVGAGMESLGGAPTLPGSSSASSSSGPITVGGLTVGGRGFRLDLSDPQTAVIAGGVVLLVGAVLLMSAKKGR